MHQSAIDGPQAFSSPIAEMTSADSSAASFDPSLVEAKGWSLWRLLAAFAVGVALLSACLTFVVLTGGIDLSIASAAAGAGMLLGISVEHGAPWGLAVVIGVLAGLGFGVANGLVIGVLKIPFFVVTLGTLAVFRGINSLLAGGKQISADQVPQA